MASGPDARTDACGALHLFSLQVPAATVVQLQALLDPEERTRAARLHSPQHRDRFVAAHGQLRQLLAAELGMEAAALTFTQGAFGKPELLSPRSGPRLHFNLSHSGNWGLVGMAWERNLGVDVEVWRSMANEGRLVQRFFSASEAAAYADFTPQERHAAFFRGWTRKEAYVKAVGRGLGLPLASFDVSLGPDSEAQLLRPAILQDQRSWALAGLPLPEGLSAAVVLESASVHIFPTRQVGV